MDLDLSSNHPSPCKVTLTLASLSQLMLPLTLLQHLRPLAHQKLQHIGMPAQLQEALLPLLSSLG